MASKPRYRLMIEGAPTEWVTDASLEATVSDDRIRRSGLMYKGLKINESVDLRESDIDVAGITVMIRSEYADAEFAHRPDFLAFLAADVEYDDTSLTLDSDTGLIAVDDVIHIGTEALLVTTVTTVTIGVTRQYWDTQAQGHYAQVEDKTEYVPIYNRLPSYEGRRVYLFRYDEDETSDESNLFDFASNYQGATEDTADKVIFRGVISRPPRLDRDGLTWLLDIEPITFLLEQEIAKTEAVFGITGIYHHSICGLAIEYWDGDGDDVYYYEKFFGFYPNNAEFLTAVNEVLETLRTSEFTHAPQSITLGLDDTNGYSLLLKTNAGSTSTIDINIISPLLGATGYKGSAKNWAIASSGEEFAVGAAFTADTDYYKLFDPVATDGIFGKYIGGSMPGVVAAAKATSNALSGWTTGDAKNVIYGYNGSRSILGYPAFNVMIDVYKDALFDTNDTHSALMIHLDQDPGPSVAVGSMVLIQDEYRGSPISAICEVFYKGTDATYGTTKISVRSKSPDFQDCFPVTGNATIQVVTSYGEKTNIGGMLFGTVGLAVEANKGTTPFITYADLDPISLLALAYFAPSEWDFLFANPITLLDLIREHLKLYGWYIHLNSVGRIAFSPFSQITQTAGNTALTIDDDYILTPPEGDFPKWEPAIDGVVSVVEIARGYDWIDDSFSDGALLVIRDVHSLSTHKNRSRGVTKIEARGNYLGEGDQISAEEGYRRAREYLSLHSMDYDVVEIYVTADVFDSVTCGSLVKVTSPHIMDSSSGTRGIENKVGLIIGKQINLDPEDGAKGMVTMRINRSEISGYTPAMRATAYTVYSGLTYTLTVTSNFFGPTGTYDTAFFSVGDKLSITEFTSYGVPNNQTGTIAAINSTTSVRVTMDGTFPTSASGKWDVEYDSDDGSLNSNQNDYCFVADSNGLLYNDNIGRRFT